MDNKGISENMPGIGIVKVDSIYSTRKQMIIRNYLDYLKLAEDCISQNYALADGIELAHYERAKKEGILLDGPSALPPILFRKSVNYSYSALCLLREGHIDATYSCIRSCVEHIWRIYFLQLAEDDKKMLLYKEEINKGRNPLDLPEDKRLTKEEKKLIWDYNHFSPGYIRKYLYNEAKCSSMNKIYGGFSNSTHPSIVGGIAEIEFRSESVEDLLKLLAAISLSLMAVGLEIYPMTILPIEDMRLKRMVDRIGETLGSLPDLFPNQGVLAQKLRVRMYTKTQPNETGGEHE